MTALLKVQAIQTALAGDWDSAISLNKKLLKENPDDIETLNRLAFAFGVLGKTKNAKSAYQKVLRLDSQNPIAIKNLRRLQSEKKNSKKTQVSTFTRPLDLMFLEETGKTKVVELVNVAEPKVVGRLITGSLLDLRIKRLKIFVLDNKEQYIGVLPDNIGKRLIKFLKGGNLYEAYVKGVNSNRVVIFMREVKRSHRFRNLPSFITSEKTHLIFEKNTLSSIVKSKNSGVDLEEESTYSKGLEESA